MINKGEAGISCVDCGYEEKVTSERMRDSLEELLEWAHGDPICPGCETLLTFEDYIRLKPEPPR